MKLRGGNGGSVPLSVVKTDWKYRLRSSDLSWSVVSSVPDGSVRGGMPEWEESLELTKR